MRREARALREDVHLQPGLTNSWHHSTHTGCASDEADAVLRERHGYRSGAPRPAGGRRYWERWPELRHRARPTRGRVSPPFHRSSRGRGASPLPRPAARSGRHDLRDPGRDGPFTTPPCDARAARGPRCRRAAARAGGGPMSTERDMTRIVRSWLRTDEHESADRVLDHVLAQLNATPQRRSWWPARRIADMNNVAKLAIAAAAVVVVAVVGINLLPAGGGVGGGGA